MGFSSYTENIIERLNEAQRSFQGQLAAFRTQVHEADFEERDRLRIEISAFKKRLNKFLDELDKRSKNLFEEAIKRLSDRRIDVYRHLEKKEYQAADARKERDKVIRERDSARENNTRLIRERNAAMKKNRALTALLNGLAAENRKLKVQLKNVDDWKAATADVKKR